jgi:hypothetical protein
LPVDIDNKPLEKKAVERRCEVALNREIGDATATAVAEM